MWYITSRSVLVSQPDQRVKAEEENDGLNGKGISVPVRGRYKRFELRVHVTQVL